MRDDREWMYEGRIVNGKVSRLWLSKMEEFVAFALRHPECTRDGKIKCPCISGKCQNTQYLDPDTVKFHLAKDGFKYHYHDWEFHGETTVATNVQIEDQPTTNENFNSYEQMVIDAFGIQPEPVNDEAIGTTYEDNEIDEQPNMEDRKFFQTMDAAKKKLFNGKHSVLSITTELMSIKSDYQAPQALIDRVCQTYHDIWPEENDIPKSFYEAKKVVSGLGLPVEKIDCCENLCMIYWGEDKERDNCKFCKHPRYKPVIEGAKKRKSSVPFKKFHYFPITPRLKRLYASSATASDMRWHAEHEMEDDRMCHPSDSEAWRHFDQVHPQFASEVRNVRLGLCTDGFQPFSASGSPYSCWPVILTPYNLPPGMCMKDEFFFLSVLIPGPKNPKGKIDVFLQPLIAELQELWDRGVTTYDVSKKENFQMRAMLLWTVNDFPAYAMLSGWSTAGKLACPLCMEDSDAFYLYGSKKVSWFDNHRKFLCSKHKFRVDTKSFRKGCKVTKKAPRIRSGVDILAELDRLGLQRVTEVGSDVVNAQIAKTCGWSRRSILWDLPYWKDLLIRHNLDVMHIEKNVFENIFNTVVDVKGKTKDTTNSRDELNNICHRPELARDVTTNTYPKASYVLDRESIQILCDWMQGLKFPDGYASNIGNCVDMANRKMFGMKSHDCHVFMQRLMPIAFRHLLDKKIWEPITELCLFFKELTSTSLVEANLKQMNDDIALILCKLEKIFPPSFFDSMEHLPVHLAYEASLGGPVQYRLMYPFERYLGKLKKYIGNTNHVEGSICNGYLLDEITKFTKFYFGDEEPTYPYKHGRNEVDVDDVDDDPERLSIFKSQGRPIGKGTRRVMTSRELADAHKYVVLNCPELEPFYEVYAERLRQQNPLIDDDTINTRMSAEFVDWFHSYVKSKEVANPFICSLAQGPLNIATSYQGFFVNGYKFHTRSHSEGRSTFNCGVCISGSNFAETEHDYYGLLDEVIELEYPALPVKKLVVFGIHWFNPVQKIGVLTHPKYNLVDVNHTKKLSYHEPFALANQVVQVYYSSYPSKKKDKSDWWAVTKTRSRSGLDMSDSSKKDDDLDPLQDDNNVLLTSLIDDDDGPIQLVGVDD